MGRRLQRLAALAVFTNMLALAGLVSAYQATAAGPGAFDAMPTPEAFNAPSEWTSGATANAVAPGLTIRLRAGSYVIHRFDRYGALIQTRPVRFSSAKVYQTLASERTFGGGRFAKITSGVYAGWWVPVAPTAPTARMSWSGGQTVTVAAGPAVGKRFFGPVVTRKMVNLPAPTSYRASERAEFPLGTFYKLADGPLAGRWVNAVFVTQGSSAQAGAPSSAPTASPSAAPTASPTIAPTPTAAPSQTATPAPTATPVAAPKATWKTLALIYRETDVTFTRNDGSSYRMRARMDDTMYNLVRKTLGQAPTTIASWSAGLAAMDLTFVDVPHPMNALDTFGGGYWVGPDAAKPDLDRYSPPGTFDSVIIVWLPRDGAVEIPVPGWGLTIPGGSWSNNAGFTSVTTPGAGWWWTESPIPDEVFVHEWLHQVLFFHQDAGRLKLDLHAGRDYGYDDKDGTWRLWYMDVMQGKVRDGDRLIGLSAEVWAAGTPSRP